MKVLGNVQLSDQAVQRLANRLEFPPVGATPNVTAYGEEYAVGQNFWHEVEVSADLVVGLGIQAVRTKAGEAALVIAVHPTYKEGYCCFCGTPNPGWECPTCGAT